MEENEKVPIHQRVIWWMEDIWNRLVEKWQPVDVYHPGAPNASGCYTRIDRYTYIVYIETSKVWPKGGQEINNQRMVQEINYGHSNFYGFNDVDPAEDNNSIIIQVWDDFPHVPGAISYGIASDFEPARLVLPFIKEGEDWTMYTRDKSHWGHGFEVIMKRQYV